MIRCPADAPGAGEKLIRFVTRLLVAAYLVEAGLVLVVAPWTGFWDRNFFAHVMPTLGAWMANAYVRGAVSGVGVITAIAGVRDLTLSFLGPAAAAPGGAGPHTLEP